jgi:hypothetical protein
MSVEYFEFCNEELLTLEQLTKFVEMYPSDKAEMMSDILISYYNVVDVLYVYDSNTITYKKINQPIYDYLVMMTRKLVFSSFNHLSEDKKVAFERRHREELKKSVKYWLLRITTRNLS